MATNEVPTVEDVQGTALLGPDELLQRGDVAEADQDRSGHVVDTNDMAATSAQGASPPRDPLGEFAETEAMVDELLGHIDASVSEEDRARCLREIDQALDQAGNLVARGRLLMCRACLFARWWKTREVVTDAVEACRLFEAAGEPEQLAGAASLGATFAARLGELALAGELAAKALSLDPPGNLRLRGNVAHGLATFCAELLDYDRAVEQMTLAVDAYESRGRSDNVHRERHNVAALLLSAVQHAQMSGQGDGRYDRAGHDRLAAAAEVLQRLAEECPPELYEQMAASRMQAELALYLGRPDEALALLAPPEAGGVTWAQGEAELVLIKARCLRALGRAGEAVFAARRAYELAARSEDHHPMLEVLAELVAAERDAGELEAALGHALELAQGTWEVHRSQTAQLVEEVWARAAGERKRRALEAETEEAYRLITTLRQAATEEERARIARELHDVVTHDVTAMLVQAEAAHFLPGGANRQVAQSLDVISQTARRMLAELHGLLGVMSTREDDGASAPRRVSDLVQEARTMGQPVELRESGQPGAVPEAVQLAAYRVVAEALTNAVKHARGRPTVVSLCYGPSALDISITTDGPERAVEVSPSVPSGGRGLSGLRERVEVLGGELHAGSRPEGGFAVSARVPFSVRDASRAATQLANRTITTS